jgi:hypothetical protein
LRTSAAAEPRCCAGAGALTITKERDKALRFVID